MPMKLLRTIFPGLDVKTDTLDNLRFLTANVLLIATIVLLSFFAIKYYLFDHQYHIAFIETIAVMPALYAFIELRRKFRLTLAALLGTFNLFFFLIAFTVYNQGENFGLIWSLSLPIYAIFLNGRKTGLLITAVYYIVLFYLAYEGIGNWQDGRWDSTGFVRLVAASLLLTFVIYYVTMLLDNAYLRMQEAHRHERRQKHEMQRLSITDPLTGLYNRRYIDEVFDRMLTTAKRNGYSFALFVMDLDRFKEYNDIYGHQSGDNALVRVAEVLQKTLHRGEDYLFRIGGEEFCGIVMASESRGIVTAVEKVRAAVEALHIPHEGNSDTGILTVSIGICLLENVGFETFDTMYKKADDVLYRAKHEGRNCTVLA
jgi:diguanylate cyclase (GGDEF)-like protein